MLAPQTGIIHGVWLDGADIAALAASGASVIHNPVSNLRLGSGIAPVRPLLQAGINVMIGTDGTSSSDALCILDAMKVAALLPSYWIFVVAYAFLGLANTVSDDARRRGRILDWWADTLDDALLEDR